MSRRNRSTVIKAAALGLVQTNANCRHHSFSPDALFSHDHLKVVLVNRIQVTTCYSHASRTPTCVRNPPVTTYVNATNGSFPVVIGVPQFSLD